MIRLPEDNTGKYLHCLRLERDFFFNNIQKAFILKGRSITQTTIQLKMSVHHNILYKIQHEACNQEKPHVQNDF